MLTETLNKILYLITDHYAAVGRWTNSNMQAMGKSSQALSFILYFDLITGTRKMEYKGNSWHETCFICHRCQQPIGTKSFIPKDNQNFCVPCYEKQFAMQCVQCKKVVVL